MIDQHAPMPELISQIINVMPFAKVLHLELAELGEDSVSLKFPMRPEFIGNSVQGILHGGVLSASIDTTGGLMVMLALVKKHPELSFEEKVTRLSRISTIDLRVDFLSPGKGEYFIAHARTLRSGNKVTVTRIDVKNDSEQLIAVGTGTYLLA